MLKVDAIFQRIACACTTITLATKRHNNQKQSDLDPSNLGKIKRVYYRKRCSLLKNSIAELYEEEKHQKLTYMRPIRSNLAAKHASSNSQKLIS